MQKVCLVVIFLVVIISCRKVDANITASYIYLSHTRTASNDSIYKALYSVDFAKYDMTLLGGDLAMNSFATNMVISHLDGIFDLKNPNTLWSVGNHDKTSAKYFHTLTGKSKYHLYQRDDITFITLDSQDSLSSIVGSQKDFLFTALDTISTSSVVLMSHKLIFMNDHPILDSKIHKVCNANKGDCYHCHNPNNFQDEVYPKLLELRNKGVQVIWVGGDLGYKKTSFEFIDEEGVVFLGNGLWYKNEDNKALVFSKKPNEPLTYQFKPVGDLYKNE